MGATVIMAASRFLVVEDDPDVTRALKHALRRHGEVVAVGTAREADRLLAGAGTWAGIFVDIGLPDGSGLDVLRRARAAYPVTRAMVLTGRVDAEAINTTFDLGGEYVVKPVTLDRIDRFCTEATSLASRLAGVVEGWVARYGMSEAQSDILARAAAGDSREKIAAARGSSVLTIKKHVANLLQLTHDESLQVAVSRLLRELVRAG